MVRVPEYILKRGELVQILLALGFPSSFAETVTAMPSTVQVVASLKSPSLDSIDETRQIWEQSLVVFVEIKCGLCECHARYECENQC